MSEPATQALDSQGPEPIRAPLFRMAVEAFEDDRRHVVLDLGRARSGTIELFGRYRCRLDVVDLPAQLHTLPEADADDPGNMGRWLDECLPPTRGESVDLVLCWNLLNYLPRQVIELLGQRLAERASPRARLHALIEYRATRMPSEPLSFAPSGLDLVGDSMAGGAGDEVTAPRYTPKDLEKRLPGFSSEKTMLLGNGMQEFLYRR